MVEHCFFVLFRFGAYLRCNAVYTFIICFTLEQPVYQFLSEIVDLSMDRNDLSQVTSLKCDELFLLLHVEIQFFFQELLQSRFKPGPVTGIGNAGRPLINSEKIGW